MSTIKQENRYLQLHTKLAGKDFLLLAINGYEKISDLFCYELTLTTLTPPDDLNKLIAQAICFSIESKSNARHYFHGHVIRFGGGAFKSTDGFYFYKAIVQPGLWFLTQTADCRVYPDEGERKKVNALDVIKKILDKPIYKNKINYDDSAVSDKSVSRDYWIQYNETDFNFVSRLLEEAGIFYFFKHEKDKHTLVLADKKSAYVKLGLSKLKRIDGKSNNPQIFSWEHNYNYRTGKFTGNAHDFSNPKVRLLNNADSAIELNGNKSSEYYSYFDVATDRDTIGKLSAKKLEAIEASQSTVNGSSNISQFTVGGIFSIDTDAQQNYFPGEKISDYVLTELHFAIHDNSYPNTVQKEVAYQNNFTCVPATVVYRPPLMTPKPIISGVQEAVVTGPDNEEFYTDEYGRMKVQFYWDRAGKLDANSSCWVRAIQHWEGILRVGTPVLVGFINGDVDHPCIYGAINNPTQNEWTVNKKNQTQSRLRRRPGLVGEGKKYNEICLDDLKDKQQLSVYASKDMQIKVENDRVSQVLNNETQNVKKNRKITIEEGDDELTINKGNLTITVSKGKCVLQVEDDITIETKGNLQLNASKNLTLSAGQAVEIKSGQDMKIKGGMNLDLSSGTGLSINAGTNVDIKASLSLNAKGSLGQISADGPLALKGAITKVN